MSWKLFPITKQFAAPVTKCVTSSFASETFQSYGATNNPPVMITTQKNRHWWWSQPAGAGSPCSIGGTVAKKAKTQDRSNTLTKKRIERVKKKTGSSKTLRSLSFLMIFVFIDVTVSSSSLSFFKRTPPMFVFPFFISFWNSPHFGRKQNPTSGSGATVWRCS